ncbi:MAG TPA: FtsX-like permease family protein, partial [Candidatus Angelobacter sp.]|nr:FtsX-like permease family protein [Candidatus Angelobacter sp.]
SPASCVINEAFAKLYFAGRSPVGRRITRVFGDERTTVEVVGVAKDVRDHSIRGDVPPRFYLPIDQGKGEMIPPEATFEIRTSGDPEQVLAAARKAILGVNPDLPITSARSMGEMIDRTNSQPRVIARLFTIFGTLALVLAATGLYGVLSYGVARRTNEIGIRMALGAGKARVIAMILGETGIMIGAGIVVGLIFAAILGRFLANQFYGVSAYDPRTIAIAVCALGFVALIAGYIPALRAARVNPVTALRND